MDTSLIRTMLERPVAVHPIIIKVTGSVKLAVMWNQLLYWTERTQDPEGWIYKSFEDLYKETGMSRTEIETARLLGMKLGILDYQVKGRPPTAHYRVKLEAMIELIAQFHEKTDAPKKTRTMKATNSLDYLKSLPEEDVRELMSKMRVSSKCVHDRAQDVIDYCEAKGKRYSDYKAALRNFIKTHLQRHPEDVQRIESNVTSVIHGYEQHQAEPRMTPEEQTAASANLKKMREELARKKAMNV